jgi:hypothetical protein
MFRERKKNVDAAVYHPFSHLSVQTREWRRTIGQDIVESEEESTRAAGVKGIVQTIAAYFELHGFSTTGLIASEMDHVRTLYVFWLSPLPPCIASSPSSARIENRSRTDILMHSSPLRRALASVFGCLGGFDFFLSFNFLWARARRWTMHVR